jgi:NitT/TauT family transport system substrate-binding protein
MAIAAKEFPDLTPPILKASMQRSYDDYLWEFSGMVTPASVRTAEAVVKAAGLLTEDVAYGEIVDMRYVSGKA